MATVNPSGWLTVLCAAIVLPLPAMAVTDAERVAVYRDFRTQFDARQYDAARPLAEKLVRLSEEQYGAEELPVSTPLTNLATVEFKLGNYPAAIEHYQRSLRILQNKSTLADKQQIRPLHGLGVSFLKANDPESAVVALKRAADLSRNTDGLFNIGQIEFIDALIEAYAATGRYAEADKESLYAMRVEEAAYGRASIKLLDRLDKLARWHEEARRYTTERAIYDRALSILQRSAPETDMRRVGPLRGIARSYRLESFYGVEGADTGGGGFNTASNGAPVFSDGTQQRRGEVTLTTALAIIDANSPTDFKARGEVLADLGDWYLISNALRRAYDTYAESWKSFNEVNDTSYLATPRLLAHRPSISSIDRSQIDPAEAVLKVVEMRFRVDRDGRLDDVTSPTTDVPDSVVRNSIASMRRSRFAPRIENGAAVATDGVVFYERVLIKATSPGTAPSSESAPESAPAPAPETPAPEPEKKEPETT
jgi:tetratricopeptide (TPR) repeat protein